ncbi:MAG: hypothetical protein JRF34_10690 [Deltaproteobacteria bacterium]|nr:hypothetical protein [Deltaproteobacteria bacterium]
MPGTGVNVGTAGVSDGTGGVELDFMIGVSVGSGSVGLGSTSRVSVGGNTGVAVSRVRMKSSPSRATASGIA